MYCKSVWYELPGVRPHEFKGSVPSKTGLTLVASHTAGIPGPPALPTDWLEIQGVLMTPSGSVICYSGSRKYLWWLQLCYEGYKLGGPTKWSSTQDGLREGAQLPCPHPMEPDGTPPGTAVCTPTSKLHGASVYRVITGTSSLCRELAQRLILQEQSPQGSCLTSLPLNPLFLLGKRLPILPSCHIATSRTHVAWPWCSSLWLLERFWGSLSSSLTS